MKRTYCDYCDEPQAEHFHETDEMCGGCAADREACPGCGAEPGDGVTADCYHEEGCGAYRAFYGLETGERPPQSKPSDSLRLVG